MRMLLLIAALLGFVPAALPASPPAFDAAETVDPFRVVPADRHPGDRYRLGELPEDEWPDATFRNTVLVEDRDASLRAGFSAASVARYGRRERLDGNAGRTAHIPGIGLSIPLAGAGR